MGKGAILVTGAPRSGTTFLGKMLSLPPSSLYLDEPFNLHTGIEKIDRQFIYLNPKLSDTPHHQAYQQLIDELMHGKARFRSSLLREDTENPLRKLARALLISRENVSYKVNSLNPIKQRWLIKDPMACFASEYLHRVFDMHTVVIMRHPGSTVASYKRLGWRYNLDELKQQSELMAEHLEPLLRGINATTLSAIEEWSLLWQSIYTTLDTFMNRNEHMLFVTHETLSLHPELVLERLYKGLSLPYSEVIKRRIQEHTSQENPTEPTANVAHVLRRNSAENIHRWKSMLDTTETDIVKSITGKLADKYYAPESWQLPNAA